MGRPLKFKNAKELKKLVEGYFKLCEEKNRPRTITGLALVLDTSRQTLLDYGEKEGFSDTIKRAKLRIENWTEEQLFTSTRTAGVIFNLTNNFGWRNSYKQEPKVQEWAGFSELIQEAERVLEEAEVKEKVSK